MSKNVHLWSCFNYVIRTRLKFQPWATFCWFCQLFPATPLALPIPLRIHVPSEFSDTPNRCQSWNTCHHFNPCDVCNACYSVILKILEIPVILSTWTITLKRFSTSFFSPSFTRFTGRGENYTVYPASWSEKRPVVAPLGQLPLLPEYFELSSYNLVQDFCWYASFHLKVRSHFCVYFQFIHDLLNPV